MNDIILHSTTFHFSQDGNTQGTTAEVEELDIDCEAMWTQEDLDSKDQCFFVLRTKGWSIDDSKDIENLTNALTEGIRTIRKELRKDVTGIVPCNNNDVTN